MKPIHVQANSEAYASSRRNDPANDRNDRILPAGEVKSVDLEGRLTALFGRHQGLNADWASCAWRIKGELWVLDNEDGTFSLVERRLVKGDAWDVSILGTLHP